MSLALFNSRLLDLVQKNYRGPAAAKLTEGFATLEKTASIREACKSLFRKSIASITPPTERAIVNFGKGNAGEDFLTLLYIDDMLARAIENILAKDYESALEGVLYQSGVFPPLKISAPNELNDPRWSFQKVLPTGFGGREAPSYEQRYNYQRSQMQTKKMEISAFIEQGRGTGSWPKRHRDLVFRFEIYKGLTQFCQLQLQKPFADMFLNFPEHPYLVASSEDLAVCGLCALLDCYFFTERPSTRSFFNLAFTISNEIPKRWLWNGQAFTLSNGLLGYMKTREGNQSYHNEQFKRFIQLNDTYQLENKKPSLTLSLASLLSESSFIWDRELFGINPDKVKAMTREEQMIFLAQNKAAVIESCFSYLYSLAKEKASDYGTTTYSDYGSTRKDEDLYNEYTALYKNLGKAKTDLLKIGLKIEERLKEKEATSKEKKRFEKNAQNAKASLEKLAASQGQNALKTLVEMFGYLEKGVDIPNIEKMTGMDQMILELLKEYRHNFFQAARFRETYQEQSDLLKVLKKDLENRFLALGDVLSDKNLSSEEFGKRFLEVYTVFSFIVFNRDVFPEMPLSDYRKRQGAQKLLKFFKKKESKLTVLPAFNKLKDQGAFTIDELINAQIDRIFSAFQQPSEPERLKALTEKEMGAINTVAQSVAEGKKPKLVERFDQLETVIEGMLLRDEAFWGSLSRLQKINAKKIAQIQAHMNACLLFINGKEASLATGMPPSRAFQRLMEDILYALGDDGIKAKRLQEAQQIVEAVQAFDLPIKKEKPFDQAIKQEILTAKRSDFKELTLEMLPAGEDPVTKQIGYILKKLKSYLIQEMTTYNYSGESEFIAKKSPKKDTGKLPLDYILQKIPARKLQINDKDLKLIEKIARGQGARSEYVNYSPQYLEEKVRDFVVENDVSTGIMNEQHLLNRIFYLQGYDLIGLTAVYQELHKEYQDRKQALNSHKSYEVVSKYQGNPQNQANVFNQTLIQWYEQKQKGDANNQDLALGVHQQFLPIFLASFFEDIQDLKMGQEFFADKKIELIKHLPGAETTFYEIKELLQGKKGELKGLARYLEETFKEGNFFTEAWLEKTYQEIKERFDLGARELLSDVSEFVLAAVILTIGIQMTPMGGVPYLSTFIGLLGAYAWISHVGPVVKDIFSFLQEGCKYLFTEKYTQQGVNQLILGLIETAFKAEQKMIGNPLWKDIRHEMAFTLFLQEEFSMLRSLGSDLAVFPDRLNYLVPKTVANTNISCMAMNLFYMFNKEFFTLVPDDLLRGADSPLFLDAVTEYLFAYEQLIRQEKFAYSGSPADKNLAYGREGGLKKQLIEKANHNQLKLEFIRTSKVYQFLQEARSNLLENKVTFSLTADQIVPVDAVNVMGQVENVRRFLSLSKDLLKEEKTFLRQTALSMQKLQQVAIPLDQAGENTALQGLLSSYYMMRFCLSLAKKLYDGEGASEEDIWLHGTGETAKDILTSTLFRESVSVLRKTAELSLASNVPGGLEALEVLGGMERSVNTFLRTKLLTVPSFKEFERLIGAFQKIAANLKNNPQIMLPMLLEYENNQNLFLPHILLQQGINTLSQELGDTGKIVLQGNFRSKALYLTNGDTELFFVNRGFRGFGMAPLMVEALSDIIRSRQDRRLLNYLGIMGSRQEQFLSSQQAIPRFRQAMEQFLPHQQRALTGPNMGSMESGVAIRNPNLTQSSSMGSGVMQPSNQASQGNFYRPAYENRPQLMNPMQDQSLNGQSASNQLPMGQNNLVSFGQDGRNGTGQQRGLDQQIGNQTNNLSSQQRIDQNIPSNANPNMIVPFMMQDPYGDPRLNTQATRAAAESQLSPIEAKDRARENPNLIQLDVQGRPMSLSGGGFQEDDLSNQLDPRGRELYQGLNQSIQNQNLPENRPMDFLGRGNAPEYQNPFNPDPEDLVQARPEGFPVGKAALIGGGLVLGAALLGNMMKKEKKRS